MKGISMSKKQIFQLGLSAVLIIVLAFGLASCKKDDNPAAAGGGGLSTVNFNDVAPTISIPSGSAATSFVLAGGTLPYAVSSAPNASVATVSLAHDTVTVTPVGTGSTSVTITDASTIQPKSTTPPKSVTINITISSSGTTDYGSGTITFNSDKGNRTFTGAGTWPLAGQGVLASITNSGKMLQFLGYNHLTGSYFDYIVTVISDPTGIGEKFITTALQFHISRLDLMLTQHTVVILSLTASLRQVQSLSIASLLLG
jgi:hypothetical protein